MGNVVVKFNGLMPDCFGLHVISHEVTTHDHTALNTDTWVLVYSTGICRDILGMTLCQACVCECVCVCLCVLSDDG